MPRAPQFDPLDEISFITNYFIQGCELPFNLFVQFSKEPAGDLLAMIISLDWEDILKDWLRPSGGRKRTPRRHGRKRPRGRISLDPNDYFGSKPRSIMAEYPGIKLPGARALFRITDKVDALNWNAAIIDGVTDIGFETLWGIISAHPELCPQMAYVNAHSEITQPMVGVAPPDLPISLGIKDNGQNFQGPLPFVMTTFAGPWTLAASANFTALSAGGMVNGALTIRSQSRGILGISNHATIGQGEDITLTASAEFEPGEWGFLARSVTSGSIDIRHATAFGFSGDWL